jgi:hypothetical protein
MMSRVWLFIIARSGGASRGICVTIRREGRGECCGYFDVSMWYPSFVSVKDRAVLAPMTSLKLCDDHMSGFMRSDKPSSFYNYYVELHLPTSCGAFIFEGRMMPRDKTSSLEQGPDFNILGTCE